jgi:hypothetical protein
MFIKVNLLMVCCPGRTVAGFHHTASKQPRKLGVGTQLPTTFWRFGKSRAPSGFVKLNLLPVPAKVEPNGNRKWTPEMHTFYDTVGDIEAVVFRLSLLTLTIVAVVQFVRYTLRK